MNKQILILFGLLCCLTATQAQQRAQWMQEAKWGVMAHYLAEWQSRTGWLQMNVEKWNEMVNGFDVEGVAYQLHQVCYIGQNWGMGDPRFTSAQIIEWTKQVNSEKGSFTWDVPVQINGLMNDEFIQQLSELGKALE